MELRTKPVHSVFVVMLTLCVIAEHVVGVSDGLWGQPTSGTSQTVVYQGQLCKVPDLICVSGCRACSMVRMPFQGQKTVRCLDFGKRSIKRNAQHGVETLLISCSASCPHCRTSGASALDHATARKAQSLVAAGGCVREQELMFDNATVDTQTLLQHAMMARWSMVSAFSATP